MIVLDEKVRLLQFILGGDMNPHTQWWCVYLLVGQWVQWRHSNVEQWQNSLKRQLGGKPHVELQQVDLCETHRNHLHKHTHTHRTTKVKIQSLSTNPHADGKSGEVFKWRQFNCFPFLSFNFNWNFKCFHNLELKRHFSCFHLLLFKMTRQLLSAFTQQFTLQLPLTFWQLSAICSFNFNWNSFCCL